jgi:membrane-bound lytic murein transglycosylase F
MEPRRDQRDRRARLHAAHRGYGAPARRRRSPRPRQSVLAAARYIKDLKDRLPKRIVEPDRTWIALAAFNIGLGHLEDARIQAQRDKLDPDRWRDVRSALPLLALPEYYDKARLGYARGGMPVAFVDRVRAYYDILLRNESPHQPRLRIETPQAGP